MDYAKLLIMSAIVALVIDVRILSADTPQLIKQRKDICILGNQYYSQGMVIQLGKGDYTCTENGDWQNREKNSGLGGCVYKNRLFSKGARIGGNKINGILCSIDGWVTVAPQ